MEASATRYLVAYFQLIQVNKQMEKTRHVFRISSFIGLIIPTKIGGLADIEVLDFSWPDQIIDER